MDVELELCDREREIAYFVAYRGCGDSAAAVTAADKIYRAIVEAMQQVRRARRRGEIA